MKLLILTPLIPYPISEGGKIAQYAVIDSIRKHCSVALVVTVYSEEDESNVNVLKQHWQDVDIRAVKLAGPKIKPGIKQQVKHFIKNTLSKFSYKKTGVTSQKTGYATENPHLVNLFFVKNRKFISEVHTIIQEANPDIVQIDFAGYIDVGLAVPAGIKKVFVHHELRLARLISFFESGEYAMQPYDTYAIELIKKQELLFLKLYDGIFVFSGADKRKLLDEGLTNNIYVSPFSVLDAFFREITKENTRIDKLVFVGGGNHSPNVDAVEWYADEIAGEINKIRKLPLHIAGKWSEAVISRYKNNPDIVFAGYVEDLVSYCQHSLMLVPVRTGSGIRSKIIYAMAQGVPVISTSMGCEGIAVKHNESILIADTPREFATSFSHVIANNNCILTLLQCAQKIARKQYSQQAVATTRMKYLQEILNN